ncbi:mannitol dehydrogenase family protein [Octadecabacter sp. 1_MG-2023]|uniref:mannitol dehydrogenase family protein n=1 Tax=unclassified Octadecabacter TaxID=196158 RepID=UPI001C0A01B0|nr:MULTISPECIES: mannitol dehydrogenase family protein [unclassified Octadecabacter]MBU2993866.1 mannitol dehydrogenase family protein [Octadecabacter sp. B2R22]MDO6735288.1 mannitol dehydrogenase family protein [Octadecabacter sp. 1_MG-2023]
MGTNVKNLGELPQSVRVPSYDRTALSVGIVHIGLGNFHRAHQAWYLHRLMDQGLAHDWAIAGAGVRPADANQRQKLLDQDCLTTLIELDPSGKSAEVIGSMIDFVEVEADNASLIAQMATEAVRIVSLTVTEGGYYQSVEGGLDTGHADVVHDAANPDTPKTAFGAMIAALKLRRANGFGPFTCQSCDNLQGNGDILHQTIIALATLSDPDLAAWIDENATFPNSMVDCIVPATGPKELELAASFGIADAVPVTHEPFRQWVIEDKFCAGRPDYDKVGATFTDDVHGFEDMKLRLLNAGHQIIATPGELLSVETIAGTMAHPLIRDLFRKIETTEIVPHVQSVPGLTPLEYVDLVTERFSNPEIYDTTRRVAFDGSSRHAGFLHPIIRDALAVNAPIEGLALIEALWARMCAGTREDGSEIKANDPFWDTLVEHATLAKTDPAKWIEQEQYYGTLAQNPVFAESFSRWLSVVWRDGTQAAIETYLKG